MEGNRKGRQAAGWVSAAARRAFPLAVALCAAVLLNAATAGGAHAAETYAAKTGYYTVNIQCGGTTVGTFKVSFSGGSSNIDDWKKAQSLSYSISNTSGSYAAAASGTARTYDKRYGNDGTVGTDAGYYRYVTLPVTVTVPKGWHGESGNAHTLYEGHSYWMAVRDSRTAASALVPYFTSETVGLGAVPDPAAAYTRSVYMSVNLTNANMVSDSGGAHHGNSVWNWNFAANQYAQRVTYQYQDADGGYGPVADAVNAPYSYGSALSWSYGGDGTYNANAGVSWTVDRTRTANLQLSRKQATAAVRYRLQEADGTYPDAYEAGASGTRLVGASVEYSRAETATHRAVSGTATVQPAAGAAAQPADAVVSLDVPRRSYTAYFDGNGGPDGEPAERLAGAPLGDLPAPEREGFRLLGWTTGPDGGEAVTPETEMPAGDTTYYAQWGRLRGDVQLRRGDAQRGGSPQGDATLAGAVFELRNANAYAVESPVTGRPVAAGGVVCTVTTDESGYAATDRADLNGWAVPEGSAGALDYGSYLVLEASPSRGYRRDGEWVGRVEVAGDGAMATVS